MQPKLSRAAIARDFDFLFAFIGLVVLGFSIFIRPLIWALPVLFGVWILVRWPAETKRALGVFWRILRALFAKGISAIIRVGNSRPAITLPRSFVGQRLLPGLPSFPWQRIALYFAAVLFALAWAEWRYRDGRGDEAVYWKGEIAKMQAEAVIRGTQAQRGLDANVQKREAEREETRAATQIIVHRTREEITHAEDLDALDAAHSRAVAELRERAEASAARAAHDYLASFAS